MTNFESLRELVRQSMPQQLEAFDRLAFRLRKFQHDDDLILFIEAAGFVALLAHQVPQAILESNATCQATLETLKATLESVAEDNWSPRVLFEWLPRLFSCSFPLDCFVSGMAITRLQIRPNG